MEKKRAGLHVLLIGLLIMLAVNNFIALQFFLSNDLGSQAKTHSEQKKILAEQTDIVKTSVSSEDASASTVFNKKTSNSHVYLSGSNDNSEDDNSQTSTNENINSEQNTEQETESNQNSQETDMETNETSENSGSGETWSFSVGTGIA